MLANIRFPHWLFLALAIPLTACQPSVSLSSVSSPNPSPLSSITPAPSLPVTPSPRHSYPLSPRISEPLSPVPSPTPTSTSIPVSHCLDKAAQPMEVPARTAPLEVHWLSAGNIWAWQETEGAAHQITSTGNAQNFYFSPDGQKIVFTRQLDLDGIRLDLWAVDRDGSNLRQLVSVEQFNSLWIEQHEAWVANQPVDIRWRPDSKQLTFSIYPYVNAVGGCDTSIGSCFLDIGIGRLTELTSPQAGNGSLDWVFPSPDGRWNALDLSNNLTLERTDGALRRENILIYPAISAGEGCATDRPYIVWTSDSQSLVAIVEDESFYWGSGTFSTWRVPVDGSPTQHLATFTGAFYNIALSPDQKYFSYWKPEQPLSNMREIHLTTLTGSPDILYASAPGLSFAGWSPDSYHFVLASTVTGQAWYAGLCGDPVPLLDPPDTSLDNLTWIDASRFLYVTGIDEQPHQLRLGQVGGESILLGPFDGNEAYYQIVGQE